MSYRYLIARDRWRRPARLAALASGCGATGQSTADGHVRSEQLDAAAYRVGRSGSAGRLEIRIGDCRSSGPAELEGRELLTDEEVAQKNSRNRSSRRTGCRASRARPWAAAPSRESPIRGNEYNSFWQDHGRPRRIVKQTSLIVDPRDGRLPYTPDARKAEARSAARYGVGPYESYLDPDTGERCLTDGVTAHDVARSERRPQHDRAEPGLRDHPSRGVPRPPHHPRRRTSARQHPPVVRRRRRPLGRRYAGRRHHELPRPHQLRVGEHLDAADRNAASGRAVHANQRGYDRVQDHRRGSGDVFAALDGVIPISRLADDTQIYEYACHEGNYAMPNLLSGGRADAAKRRASSK